jgi:hypothetical protein
MLGHVVLLRCSPDVAGLRVGRQAPQAITAIPVWCGYRSLANASLQDRRHPFNGPRHVRLVDCNADFDRLVAQGTFDLDVLSETVSAVIMLMSESGHRIIVAD